MPDQYLITSQLKYVMSRNTSRSVRVARAANTYNVTLASAATLLSYPIEVAKESPLAQYRLGETESLTTAEDVTENERHGSYFGGVLNTAGSLYLDSDTAKSFNGSDAYATFPDLSLSTDCTIEGIFFWQSGTASLMRDASTGSAGWIFAFASGANLAFRIAGTSYTTSVALSAIQNAWVHYALVKSGSTARYYINGAHIHTQSGVSSTASQATWYLMKDGLDANFINGRADEIAFYDSALAGSTILTHSNAMHGTEDDPA